MLLRQPPMEKGYDKRDKRQNTPQTRINTRNFIVAKMSHFLLILKRGDKTERILYETKRKQKDKNN